MQSSPPNRAWNGEGSHTESHYSVNLDALDDDAMPGSPDDIPRPKVERIFSEEIDGPSDFTQNMGHWLRGRTLPKDSSKTARGPAEAVAEKPEAVHHGEDQRGLLDVANDEDADNEHTQAISHHTPVGTPPRISILQLSNRTDQFSSEFVPNAVTSTPFPQPLQTLLQPSVEDYFSELTPAYLAQRHPRISHNFQSPLSDSQKHSPMKEIDESSDLHLDARSSEQSAEGKSLANERDCERRTMEELQAKCEQLENYNTAIQEALQQERKLRKQESLAHDSRMAEARQRVQEVLKTHEEALLRNSELQRGSDALRLQMAESMQQDSFAGPQSPERSDSQQAELLDRLQDQLAKQASEHNQQIQALQRNLTFAQNSQKEAEETARVYREDLEELQEDHEAEVKRLSLKSEQNRESQAVAAELEESLRLANVHISQLQAANRGAALDLKTTQLQLQSVRKADDTILSRITGERFRAVELATSLQVQLQSLRKQLHDSQSERDVEFSKLRSGHDEESNVSRQELVILRSELQAKVSELNEAILDRDEARDAQEKSQAELDTANNELAHTNAVNAEMDDRVTSKLRKREQHWREKEQKWREKLEELDRERQVMAKALLHQWGRDELGIGEPQLYAFKYAEGGSPTNSSGSEKAKYAVTTT